MRTFDPYEWVQRRAELRQRARTRMTSIGDGIRRLHIITGDQQFTELSRTAMHLDDNKIDEKIGDLSSESSDLASHHNNVKNTITKLETDIRETFAEVDTLKAERQEHGTLTDRLERLQIIHDELRQAEIRQRNILIAVVGSIILVLLAWLLLFHG
jgi:chromosome segregation ATPase